VSNHLPGLFSLTNLPLNKSPPQSPHVVMSTHHLLVYLLIEAKNAGNDVKLHPEEEKTRGAV
jgi:hypothetical protein